MNMINPNSSHKSYQIIIDKHSKLAEIAFCGGVSLQVANNAFSDLIAHPSFKYNMSVMYDFTGAIIETDMKELELHSEFVGQYTDKRGCNYKLAMVSDESLNSALLNVYRLLISKTSIEAEVFGSKNQALRWLNRTFL